MSTSGSTPGPRLRALEAVYRAPQTCTACYGHPTQVICTDGPTLPDGHCPACGAPARGRVHHIGVPLATFRRMTRRAGTPEES